MGSRIVERLKFQRNSTKISKIVSTAEKSGQAPRPTAPENPEILEEERLRDLYRIPHEFDTQTKHGAA